MQQDRAIHRLRTELDRARASDGGPQRLILEGQVTLDAAGHLRGRLLEAIDSSSGDGYLLVDLAAVESMDMGSLAVLVEGVAVGRVKQRPVVLCGPSRQLKALFRLAGLEGSACGCKSCQEEAERLHLALAS